MGHHETPKPLSPAREALIQKRDRLLMEIVKDFQAELEHSYRTGDFRMTKAHWQAISEAVEAMEKEYDACWGKAALISEAPSGHKDEDHFFLRFPELIEEFQKELTYAFASGNFNHVKNYCRRNTEKLEFMEKKYKEETAHSNGKPLQGGRAEAVNHPKENNGTQYRPE